MTDKVYTKTSNFLGSVESHYKFSCDLDSKLAKKPIKINIGSGEGVSTIDRTFYYMTAEASQNSRVFASYSDKSNPRAQFHEDGDLDLTKETEDYCAEVMEDLQKREIWAEASGLEISIKIEDNQ